MELIQLFKIGFLTISIFDVLDILIVGYLFFVVYKLSKGSLAFNIIIGVFVLSVVYWLVNAAEMSLLSGILGGIVNLGFIVLVVVFQPEIRRFLIFLGRNFLKNRSNLIQQLLGVKSFQGNTDEQDKIINKIITVTEKLASQKTGALIVFSNTPELDGFNESGVRIDANISTRLIESIFHKESPIHDGAMIISHNKIYSVANVLPLSHSKTLPDTAGLRHRAAVGVSEKTDTFAVIVSEESGKISTAKNGKLQAKINGHQLQQSLKIVLEGFAKVNISNNKSTD